MTQSAVKTTRRTVAKGMAWTVPVVMAAAPASAAVTTGFCVGSLCLGAVLVRKCCPPGQVSNYYWASVSFTNNGAVAVTASFSFTVSPSNTAPVTFAGSGLVNPGQTRIFLIAGNTAVNNCANATYPAFDITFSDGTSSGSVSVPGGSTGGATCDGAPPPLAGVAQAMETQPLPQQDQLGPEQEAPLPAQDAEVSSQDTTEEPTAPAEPVPPASEGESSEGAS